jgi:hypothetical protein
MADIQGHQAALGGRVSIERLISRRERLRKVLGRAEGNSPPDEDKREALESELATIESTLQTYKAALADL